MRTTILLLSLMLPSVSLATVSTTTARIEYTCSGASDYAVTFPFLATSDLVVTKYTGSCGSATSSVLTETTDYSVARTGAEAGTVSLVAACTTGYCLRIGRDTSVTQTTEFRAQGSFSPAAHENAFDRLTMTVQELELTAVEGEVDLADHIAADDHTGYALLLGRSGGQTLYGGIDAGDDLTLLSTSDGTAGDVTIGAQLYVDGVNDRVGVNDSTPGFDLDVTGTGRFTDNLYVYDLVYGSGLAAGDLTLASTSNATKGLIYIGAAGGTWFNETYGSLFLGGTLFGGNQASDNLTISSNSNNDGNIFLGSTTVVDIDEGAGAVRIGSSITTVEIEATVSANGGVVVDGITRRLPSEYDIPSSGDANPATYTLTPAYSVYMLGCLDADTCELTMGETDIDEGHIVTIANNDTNVIVVQHATGVAHLSGAVDYNLGQYHTLTLIYNGYRWLEIGRGDN